MLRFLPPRAATHIAHKMQQEGATASACSQATSGEGQLKNTQVLRAAFACLFRDPCPCWPCASSSPPAALPGTLQESPAAASAGGFDRWLLARFRRTAVWHTLAALLITLPQLAATCARVGRDARILATLPVALALLFLGMAVMWQASALTKTPELLLANAYLRNLLTLSLVWPDLLLWRVVPGPWYCLLVLPLLAPLPHELNLLASATQVGCCPGCSPPKQLGQPLGIWLGAHCCITSPNNNPCHPPAGLAQAAIATLAEVAMMPPGAQPCIWQGLRNCLLASASALVWAKWERGLKRQFQAAQARRAA